MINNYRYNPSGLISDYDESIYAQNQDTWKGFDSQNIIDLFDNDPATTIQQKLANEYGEGLFTGMTLDSQKNVLERLGTNIDSEGFLVIDGEKYECIEQGTESYFKKVNSENGTEYIKVLNKTSDNDSIIARTQIINGKSTTKIYDTPEMFNNNSLCQVLEDDGTSVPIEQRLGGYQTFSADIQKGALELMGATIDENGSVIIDGEKYETVDNGDKSYFKKQNADGTTDYIKLIMNPADFTTSVAVTSIGSDGNKITKLYRPDKSVSSNGYIGVANQGKRANCWLLASLTSVCSSKSGRNLMKEVIKDNNDGTYTVALKGINKEYTVLKSEVMNAKGDLGHSYGDDDALIMELALDKLYNSDDAKALPDEFTKNDKGETKADIMSGGDLNKLMYLLTGKEVKYVYNTDHPLRQNDTNDEPDITGPYKNAGSINDIYNLIENNSDDYIATLGFATLEDNQNAVVEDIYGNQVVLVQASDKLQNDKASDIKGHMWSVKSVDGDIVTMTNPVFSGIEVKVSKEAILPYLAEIECYGFNQ